MTLDAKTFSELITFTRSTTGTRVNASGLVETVAIDQPRFDFDPVTGQALGILIEESRTNLMLYSEQFDNTAWQKVLSTVTANNATAPDGSGNADTLTFSSGGYVYQQISSYTTTIGATVTVSCFVKSATQVVIVGGGSVAGTDVYSVMAMGNGWYLQKVTRTFTTATTGNVQLVLTSAIFGAGSIVVWGAQMEIGSFRTSYIPTTSATVTRSADSASVALAAIPAYSSSEGTFVMKLKTLETGNVAATRFVLSIDGSGSKRLLYIADGQSSASSFDGTVTIAASGDATGTDIAVATSYSTTASSRKICLNGGAVVSGTLGAGYASGTNLRIGNGCSLWVRSLTYYPAQLTDAELQQVSTL